MPISPERHTYFIAEAGVNHNGSLKTALQLIETASKSGADAVKFQTFQTEKIVTPQAAKAPYQQATTGTGETQFEMLKKLELSHKAHFTLQKRCIELGIEFLSTPFDLTSLSFLVDDLQISRLKISSGDITNGPLLQEAARSGLPIILSTGMATLDEIHDALLILASWYGFKEKNPAVAALMKKIPPSEITRLLSEKVTLLHCTTQYPTPFEQVNLRAMKTLRDTFGLPTGLSDHTAGISVALAATALEARVIEKHFTLDKSLPGPDHKASLSPEELHKVIQGIREVEKALGDNGKQPTSGELKNIQAARKSLHAARDIKKGEIITASDILILRPGNGPSPMHFWDWLDRLAPKDFKKGAPLSEK